VGVCGEQVWHTGWRERARARTWIGINAFCCDLELRVHAQDETGGSIALLLPAVSVAAEDYREVGFSHRCECQGGHARAAHL
jgi:hypothetical protein